MQCSQPLPLRDHSWLTFIVRHLNTLYKETSHKRESKRKKIPKIQFMKMECDG
jgi:hypothetical protein